MQTYTQTLAEAIDAAMPDMLADQRLGAIVVVLGALLLGAGGSMLAHWIGTRLGARDARSDQGLLATVRSLSKVDLVLVAGMFVVAALRLMGAEGIPQIYGALFALALAVAACALLLLRRGLYIVPMALFWWVALLPDQLQAVAAASSDIAGIDAFASAGKVGVYAAYSAILQRAASAVLVCACLTVLIVYRYARLRAKLVGARAEADMRVHGDMRARGGAAEIVRVVLLALLATVLVVPNFIGGAGSRIVSAVSGPRATYEGVLGQLAQDPSLLADQSWTESLRAASDALIGADDRCFQVRAEAIPTWEVPFFAAYTEASFSQMQAVEALWALARDGVDSDAVDEAAVDDLIAGYTQTARAQDEARLTLYANGVYAGGVAHGLWEQMCHSIRTVQLLAGQVVFGVILALLGIACVGAAVLLARRMGAPPAPSPADAGDGAATSLPADVTEKPDGQVASGQAATEPPAPLADVQDFALPNQQFGRTQRILVALLIVVVALGMVAVRVVPDILDQRDAQERSACIQAMAAVTQGNLDEIDGLLLAAQLGRIDLADPDRRSAVLEAVDAQLGRIARLEAIDPLSGDFAGIETDVRDLCAYQRDLLEQVKESVVAGRVPPDEVVAALAALPGERFERLYTDIAAQSIVSVFSNL